MLSKTYFIAFAIVNYAQTLIFPYVAHQNLSGNFRQPSDNRVSTPPELASFQALL